VRIAEQVVRDVVVVPSHVETPAVVVDYERLGANVQSMACELAARGVELRPHFKSHKTVAIAQLQAAQGATGFSCATLAEAEVLADAGFTDLFVAYPLYAAPAKQARLRRLHEAAHLRVGFDSARGAVALGEAVADSGEPLEVLVEVDCGYGRTGVAPELAGELGDAARDNGLRVIGAFTHAGHAYDDPDSDAIERAARDEERSLSVAWSTLEAHRHRPTVASAGSTPTALRSACGIVTEERPGTYVFGDRQLLGLGAMRMDQLALVVAATVVSMSVPGQFVLDAGAKALGRDRMAWLDGFGAVIGYPDARIDRLDDHHAMVQYAGRGPSVGDVVAVLPNSACSTINLATESLVVAGGKVVARWAVDARACSQ
jgi:D-serine deaminase-like pyridoxal phosphate-dependent protein